MTYNRFFSTCLLNLAISIRVSLKEEPEYSRANTRMSNCGIFEDRGSHGNDSFSFKDVCDKLIHAEQIFKPIERGVTDAGCKLIGSYRGEPRELGLGVQILCEYVLKWVDEIDARAGSNQAI